MQVKDAVEKILETEDCRRSVLKSKVHWNDRLYRIVWDPLSRLDLGLMVKSCSYLLSKHDESLLIFQIQT